MGEESPMIEREIVERIKAAKIRLRLDKVVLRVVGGLQAALADVVPDEVAVIFTVTAPIRLPAKTAAFLESLVRDARPCGERREVIHEQSGSNPSTDRCPATHAQGARFRT
jgi:hypothetical protein